MANIHNIFKQNTFHTDWMGEMAEVFDFSSEFEWSDENQKVSWCRTSITWVNHIKPNKQLKKAKSRNLIWKLEIIDALWALCDRMVHFEIMQSTHLTKYKVNQKIQIELREKFPIWYLEKNLGMIVNTKMVFSHLVMPFLHLISRIRNSVRIHSLDQFKPITFPAPFPSMSIFFLPYFPFPNLSRKLTFTSEKNTPDPLKIRQILRIWFPKTLKKFPKLTSHIERFSETWK